MLVALPGSILIMMKVTELAFCYAPMPYMGLMGREMVGDLCSLMGGELSHPQMKHSIYFKLAWQGKMKK